MTQVRTRFAPSPTGFLHIGSIHTALFAWLYARQQKGVFILRIEDTDNVRKVEGAVEAIMDDLRWLGLDCDEGPGLGGQHGPYIQSERLPLYKVAAQKLVDCGAAYKCYCSQERLEQLREFQTNNKLPPGYDRRCRNLTDAERAEKEKEGITPVIRFKTPLDGQTTIHDLIWGDVTFKHNTLEDLVLMKSDGFPTYHLANVVDDHDMQITHVIRAEEWMSSGPCHILLYNALGYEVPQFAHLPMMLGKDRAKLGKRHGSTSIGQFREEGYLPETMINFLALMGWSLDDKTEIFSLQDLIKYFTIERVSKTSAVFNHEKLEWLNGVYIRKLTPEEFAKKAMPFLERWLPESVKKPINPVYTGRVLALVQDRARTLKETAALTEYFFVDVYEYNSTDLISKGMDVEKTRQALTIAGERLAKQTPFDAASLEPMLRALAEELGLKAGQLFGSLRTAITGRTATPPLFQMMDVLGKERTLYRIQDAVKRLES
ncbi:MAG: glutamate--tRNA ligase [Dehalococcoidales bacterium]|nr:glutamate--tRNA ligase [Dehalococcoidales bacterium]